MTMLHGADDGIMIVENLLQASALEDARTGASLDRLLVPKSAVATATSFCHGACRGHQLQRLQTLDQANK
jgi:hypothetical protein